LPTSTPIPIRSPRHWSPSCSSRRLAPVEQPDYELRGIGWASGDGMVWVRAVWARRAPSRGPS
jgi:hypothetical protein